MPSRSNTGKRFKTRLVKKTRRLLSLVREVQRAIRFAEEGDLRNSFNILATVGTVYDIDRSVHFLTSHGSFMSELHGLYLKWAEENATDDVSDG